MVFIPSVRNRYIILLDLLLIMVSVLGAYAIRLDLVFYVMYTPSALWMIATAVILKPMVYFLFGLYRRVWVYASIQELKLIVVAVTTASGVISLVMWALFNQRVFIGFPRSALVIDWMLSLLFVGGLRFAMRVLAESRSPNVSTRSGQARHVLIIGAGDAGALVVRELQKNRQLNLVPIGFLDDDLAKQRHQIYGVQVVGTLSDLPNVLDNRHVDEVIIAIPSAPGRVVRLVADVCRLNGTPFRTMPGIYELLGGKVSVSRLREVDITDLLRREPARINNELVGASLGGRVVLVTGAGGSIGRELCRQIARWGPAELLLLGHGENSIFEALLEMNESFPLLPIHAIIADVRDRPRLQQVFRDYQPQVVFHAAAHKHVPLMESNIVEALTNNIQGTRNVVDLCAASHVERMVMVSTDKAIRPANVMGATKRMAEMIVLDAAGRTGRSFSVVRFGNVLGSRGSVVPLFKRQIARGGPVTITHPDMKRYFMTIPEAVHLVLQASAMGKGGEVFVLNMGEQVRIIDLAEDLIRLSGLQPGRDIEIVFTGIRPGEKLSEDLWDKGATFEPTNHPDIFQACGQDVLCGETLYQSVDELIRLAIDGDGLTAVDLMDELIPDSAVHSTPPLDMTAID
jgi:FlaA1/EpsC-like NDP-sugar epimerase